MTAAISTCNLVVISPPPDGDCTTQELRSGNDSSIADFAVLISPFDDAIVVVHDEARRDARGAAETLRTSGVSRRAGTDRGRCARRARRARGDADGLGQVTRLSTARGDAA